MYTIILALFVFSSLFLLYSVQSRIAYLFLLRFYIAIEYIMFVFFFYLVLENKIIKKIILFSIIPFLIYCIYNYFTSDNKSFNNYPALVEFFVFIIILLYYFFEKMKIVSKIPMYQSISFWLSVGLFLYFSGNFFFLLLINSSKNVAFIQQMQIIYSVVIILKNIILSLAWFAHERIETDADTIKFPNGLGLDDDLPFLKPNQA